MDGMLNRCEAVTHKVLAGLFLGLLVLILCWTAALFPFSSLLLSYLVSLRFALPPRPLSSFANYGVFHLRRVSTMHRFHADAVLWIGRPQNKDGPSTSDPGGAHLPPR